MASILIVEDELEFHSAYRRVLEPRGHQLAIVETAEQAIGLFDAHRLFDLVIIDLLLPGMDGAELARRLRGRPETSRLPLLVFTCTGPDLGLSLDESDETWLPADVVVDKSEGAEALAEKVDGLLRSAREKGLPPAVPQRRGQLLSHVHTVCPECGAGCGMYLVAQRGAVTGAAPSAAHPVSRGRLCARGWRTHEALMLPGRLEQPMIRQSGELTAVSWDEALDLCVSRFEQTRDRYGGDALAVVTSAACTNEETFLAQKLARAFLKTNNIDHLERESAGAAPALAESFGCAAASDSTEDIARAACLFAIGLNVGEADPLIGRLLHLAARHKAALMVADPLRSDTASLADIHLQMMPGTEAELLAAMANVIIREGLHDREYIERRAEGFDEFRRAVAGCTAEKAAEVCRLHPDAIREAARVYARNKPAAFLLGAPGPRVATAAANLAIITGNVGIESSGVNPLLPFANLQGARDMGAVPDLLPGYQALGDPAAVGKFEKAWRCTLPPTPGLAAPRMMQAASAEKLKALFLIGTSPLKGLAAPPPPRSALDKLDFLVSQSTRMTPACRLAHVVLPAADFGETDGTFTNWERRIQRVRKALDPPGDRRPGWQILADMSTRAGLAPAYAGPDRIMEEIASLVPVYGGVSYDRLEKAGLQWPCPHKRHPGTAFLHEGRFARGRGRLRPPQPRCPAREADGDYPMILCAVEPLLDSRAPAGTVRSDSGMGVFRRGFCLLNPGDAQHLGLTNGADVRIATPLGSFGASLRISDRIRPGVIWMSSGMGAAEEAGALRRPLGARIESATPAGA